MDDKLFQEIDRILMKSFGCTVNTELRQITARKIEGCFIKNTKTKNIICMKSKKGVWDG